MSIWLHGDLSGVNPRAELELLRGTVSDAVRDGHDLRAFWTGLAELDPVACAELAIGPRALNDPAAVRSVLCVAPVLETIMSASGLYSRLVALAPSEAGEIARHAAQRHPDASWLWRVGRADPGPMFEALCAHDEPQAILAAWRAEHYDLALSRVRTADDRALNTIYRSNNPAFLERCLAAILEAGGSQPVVPWLAAWHGPQIDGTFARVALRLESAEARRRLLAVSADLPITRRHLEAQHE
ncbi:MAG: hypothetical protein ACI9MC_002842 [Kiritimatiellia bacterium]|jgi:hypothetical protein